MSTTIEKKQRVKKEIPTCIICAEKLNKTTHANIKCLYCPFEACQTCCRTYILNESIVKCMNPECGREWTRKFIRDIFPLSFITGQLRDHRENILFQREQALLPATQPIIEARNECKRLDKIIYEKEKVIREIRREILEIQTEKQRITLNPSKKDRTAFVRACPDENCRGFLSTAWKCGVCEKWTCPECHVVKGYTRDEEHTCNPDNVATARLLSNDTKPCPKCGEGIFKIDGCFASNTRIPLYDGSIKMSQNISIGDVLQGDDGEPRIVLSTTTGVDNLYTINQLNGISYTVNSQHTLVLKMTCSAKIYEIKVEDFIHLPLTEKNELFGYNTSGIQSYLQIIPQGMGTYYGWEINENHRFILPDTTVVRNCDQMWCTNCHTAFSWRTGTIENRVHNPHYYEWMRRTNNGEVPREVGDNPCQQGGQLNHYTYETISIIMGRKHRNALNYRQILTLVDRTIRNTIHLSAVERPPRPEVYERRNENLRVMYLSNDISEADFKLQLQRDDKRHHKSQELSEIFDIVVNVVTDIMFRFVKYIEDAPQNEICTDMFVEINRIVDYANECLADVSKTYGTTRMALDYNIRLYTGNYAINKLAELYPTHTEESDEVVAVVTRSTA